MTDFLSRLNAVLEPVTDEWGETLWLHTVTPPLLRLTMRRIRGRAAALVRIDEASEPLSLGHCLKRVYSSLRSEMMLVTPMLNWVKRIPSENPPRQWGGNGFYWDVVTTK